MFLDSLGLLYAALTGAAVVLVTWLGDRLGGRVGGLLATAPITTSAAHVVLATSVAPELAAGRVLQGVQALIAVTFGILAFFYTVWATEHTPSRLRLFLGLGSFVAVFVGFTLIFATWPLPLFTAYLLFFALHAALAMSFMREVVPVAPAGPKRVGTPGRSMRELTWRFVSGAVVVLLVRWLVTVAPALAGALAVVPAVFIVSLTVLGLRHDAVFAARASQAGLFGATGVGVFVLIVAGALHLGVPGGIWTALPFAWAGYLGVLLGLGNVHRAIQQRAGLVEKDPSPGSLGDLARNTDSGPGH